METKLITIKDYAKKQNITYEAVRKQIQVFRNNELKDHIIKKNKTQYLDEFAVDFLDSRRRERPIVVMQIDKDEEIQRLTDENKALILQITNIQNQLIQIQKELSEEKDNVKQLQSDKILLLESIQQKEKKRWWRFGK